MLDSKGVRILLNFAILVAPWIIFGFDISRNYIYVFISIILVSIIFLKTRSNTDEKVNSLQKAVLITGCDSGFGHHSAKRLDSKGFTVFACCLFPEGAGASDLRQACSDRLKILPLDVTKNESVMDALKFVQENLGSNDLWALVNNAGIAKGLTVDLSSIKDFEDTLDVNTLGPVRVTKAFLPLLKQSKGRVINVTSAVARLTIPFFCPYGMSKHAALAFSECLSMEMESKGVKVISIEPDIFRTAILAPETRLKAAEDTAKEINKGKKSFESKNYMRKVREYSEMYRRWGSSKIDIVVDDIESAICEKKPSHVYRPSCFSFGLALRYVLENMPNTLYQSLFLIFTKLFRISFYDINID